MAVTCKLVKKAGMKASGKKAKVGDPIPAYVLVDNEDGSFTVTGTDAAGASVDISAVATLDPPPTSSAPATLSVDPPAGMLVACHGLLPGHADVTVTATFTDGSVGPFVITVPADVGAGPATSLTVTFTTPTIRT